MKWIAPLSLALAIGAAPLAATPGGAAELPDSTKAILKELKLEAGILSGLDKELKVPSGWVEKARKEGKLTIVSSWDQAQFVKMTGPFKARYPFIELNYSRASYNARVIKTLVAFKEGRYITDMVSGFGGGYFQYKAANALADLRDIPNFQRLKKGTKDPSGLWLGQRLRYWCISYNTNLVKKADLPKRWEDLITNKRWHGRKIGMGNRPQLWLLMLWGAKGKDWTTDFMKRFVNVVKPQFRKEGTNALISLTIAGEFDAAIPAAAYRTAQYVEKGAPIAWHCPEPVPLAVSEMGILRDAPHIHAAKLFANWFLSKEGQVAQYAANFAPPVHPDLQTKEFLVFPDEILGKEVAFRSPELEGAPTKAMYAAWTPIWTAGTGGPKKIVTLKTTLEGVKRGGRVLVFKDGGKEKTIRVSGRRTKVMIKGKVGERANLRAGMACEITAPEGGREAKTVACK